MWSFRKILVPTDFSKPAEAALEAAIELAKKFECPILLMHAVQARIDGYAPFQADPSAALTHGFEDAAKKCLEEAASAHATCGIPIQTLLCRGAPWEQILKAAKAHDVALIVMGSRGLHGLARALMGSAAERVVRFSSVPVLTVHGPGALRARAQPATAADELVEQWLI